MDRMIHLEDHFSLKDLGKGISNVAKDAVKLGVAPVKQAISSVTGKQYDTKFSTGVGKTLNAVQSTGAKLLNTTVKSAADTITFGGATKLANVVRSKENKEKPFDYNESRNLGNTGVKVVDKIAPTLGTVSKVVGGIAGSATLASGIKTLAEKSKIPANVLNQVKTQAQMGLMNNPQNLQSTQQLQDMKDGNELPYPDFSANGNSLASFSGTKIMFIGLAIVVLLLLASSKHGQRTIKRYAKK